MLYSVLNRNTRQYDYYQTPEADPWHAPPPPRAKSPSALGAVPEEAAWPLPASARHIGTGECAQGRIATKRAALPGMGDIEPALEVAATAAAMVAGLALLVKIGGSR